jgi:hypothetical protein
VSHFTTIKTVIKKLQHLKKALNEMNIKYLLKENLISIPQSNNRSLTFAWNGKSYDFIADLEFWQQDLSFEGFLQKIQKNYNYYSILDQTEKLGFIATEKVQTSDGKFKITLQNYLH